MFDEDRAPKQPDPEPDSLPRAESGRRADLAGVALVAILACVAMAPALRGGFLPGDDEYFVLQHSCVNRPGLLNAVRLFGIVHRDLYQPLPMLSFAVDTALYGGRAWGYHLTNILWHVLAVVLVWVIVRIRWERWWLATLAASLMAVHPLAVEPVATITGRFVQMGVTFSLGAVLAMLLWSRRSTGESGWLAAAVLLTALAMMSKVQPALPILLLLVTYGPRRRMARAWWTAWGALTGLTAGFVLLAWWTTSRTGLMDAAQASLPGSVASRALFGLGTYLANLIRPTRLSTWYLVPVDWSWQQPLIWVGAVGLAGLILVAVICRLRGPRAASVGAAWYLAAISPWLAASSARNLIAADRYTYLANVGICVLFGAIALAVLERLRQRSARSVDIACAVLLVVAAVVLVPASWAHASHYRTGLDYYRRVAELYPDSRWTHLNVGWELLRAGRLDEAETEARAEMALPTGDTPRATRLLGAIAEKRGEPDRALALYRESAASLPHDPESQYRLAGVLHKLGRADEAAAAYESALKLHPGHLPSLEGLTRLRQKQGLLSEARDVLYRILEINPQHTDALTRLGTIELARRNYLAAERCFRRAIEIDPNSLQARTNLAVVLTQTNRQNEALRQYEEVLSLDPGFVSARLNRAGLYQGWGQNEQAAEDYRAILSSDPGCVPALQGLQDVMLKVNPQEGPQGAVRLWSVAIKLAGPHAELLAGLAWAQALAGMDAEAEQTAKDVLAKDESQSTARLARVLTGLHKGNDRAAIEAFDAACGKHGLTWLEELDRAGQAISAYGLQHPKEPLAYFLLGRIMLARNNPPMAERTFDELKKVSQDAVWQERIDRAMSSYRASTQPAPATSPTTRQTPSTTTTAAE
ncbi:MAG: tetratricopeptide repeat protein [Phycisphaerae bacterium]|nr:tetratricopeptide repeat protein [Phycisphaerae bacterium]